MGTAREHFRGITFTQGKASGMSIRYVVEAADRNEVIEAVYAEAPLMLTHGFGFVRRQGITETDELTDGWWLATVGYASASTGQREPGDPPRVTFRTTGGTQHVQTALAERSYVPAGSTAIDFAKTIGNNGDSVDGCDVPLRVFEWTETHVFEESQITPAYVGQLWRLTGTTNNAIFRDFLQVGEGLFQGAAGNQRQDGRFEVEFAFAASPNLSGLTIGTINSIVKSGWEYLWVRYEKKPDANVMRMSPRQVIVNKVVEAGTWANLGI